MLHPYGSEDNFQINTALLNLDESKENVSFEYKNFKLFKIQFSSYVKNLQFTVKTSDCIKMFYFLSEEKDIPVEIYKDKGYPVELNLENILHDFTKKSLLQNFPNNFDLKERLETFRKAFNLETANIQLNFFCPYWREMVGTKEFEGNFSTGYFEDSQKDPTLNVNLNNLGDLKDIVNNITGSPSGSNTIEEMGVQGEMIFMRFANTDPEKMLIKIREDSGLEMGIKKENITFNPTDSEINKVNIIYFIL